MTLAGCTPWRSLVAAVARVVLYGAFLVMGLFTWGAAIAGLVAVGWRVAAPVVAITITILWVAGVRDLVAPFARPTRFGLAAERQAHTARVTREALRNWPCSPTIH